ncbi:MAG: glycosyltransferase family 4 protein [Bacteroidales bacterium]|nr:glycosyltransferase family 4 protein [Bacteroidales bacterium]
MDKKKFFIVTTIPDALKFLNGQYELIGETFDITAISSQRENLEAAGIRYGVKVHCVPMSREISVFQDFLALLRFVFFFRRERPSVVHGNTPKGGLLSMLAAWLTRVPVRIYVCHGLRYQGCSGLKRKLLMFMEMLSCHCATHVISVSNGVKKALKDDGISNKEPVVIWNGSISGVDAVKFDPHRHFAKDEIRKSLGLETGTFVLTFVGRMVKDKGINELVEAFTVLSANHPDIRLLLIGIIEDGGNLLSADTREIIEDNPAIIAPGERSDIPEILSITNVFVLPSYREGLPISLIEAGAMGTPIIATDVVGCNEVITNEETGLLIPSHSSADIVRAVEKLYSNQDFCLSIGEKCREAVLDRYESGKVHRMYMDYYLSLVDEGLKH